MAGVMAGLNYAAQQGITHRDLKMSNVLLSSDGQPKLVDFGLAGLKEGEAEIAEGFSRRTVLYAGLERATGVRIDDPRSDIFFAGTIFYQMLSGMPALPEGNTIACSRRARPSFATSNRLLELVPKLPPPLAMVVNKALEFDPERRYQTPIRHAGGSEDWHQAREGGARRRRGRRRGTDQLRRTRRPGPAAQAHDRRVRRENAGHAPRAVQEERLPRAGAQRSRTRAAALFDDPSAADIVLFTTGINGRPALEAFNRFGQESVTRDVPAILLLDENHLSWEDEAQVSQHRIVAKMPIKMRQLRELIVHAIGKRALKTA